MWDYDKLQAIDERLRQTVDEAGREALAAAAELNLARGAIVDLDDGSRYRLTDVDVYHGRSIALHGNKLRRDGTWGEYPHSIWARQIVAVMPPYKARGR